MLRLCCCASSAFITQCSFGLAPSALVVLPVNRVTTGNQPDATILDNEPLVNIMPFGMCASPANPSAAAVTSAAIGVLTPMPCIPVTPAPWATGAPTVLIADTPALDNQSTLMCTWGGVIQIISPGEFIISIP
jgi:hypothetical protein